MVLRFAPAATAPELRSTRSAIFSGSAGLALMLGFLVYATERDAAHVALMPAAATLSIGPVFGALGQWLPSFVHPFAFSLLWAAVAHPDL